ncbi:hypothetical protein E4T56_gene629 [Termitomyces sp. T112]|nr:hypothetical protein E4T56_gene629 [Termitomyces sp. T112]
MPYQSPTCSPRLKGLDTEGGFTQPVPECHDVPGVAAPPTDPIRIPPWPDLGLYPTPVDSTQLRQPPPSSPPPSEAPSNPLPLAFPYREALYKDNWSSGGAPEEEGREEFSSVHKPELLEEAVELGDWIYTTTLYLLPSIVEIHASQTTSQQLAQVFAANSMLQEFWDVVFPYLHAFEYVFSKALFDLLLEHKLWDHAIELLPDSMPTSCKVYLLAPKEQDEFNAFLQENLDSSCIYSSKSSIASLAFFIKRKDSLL